MDTPVDATSAGSHSRQAAALSSLAVIEDRLASDACRRLAAVYRRQIDAMPVGARIVPSVSSFDLPALGSHLEDMVLYQVTADQIIFRLLGERTRARFPMVRPGTDYLTFVSPERRPQALLSMRNCLHPPCAMACRNLQTLTTGRVIACEALAVPLRRNDGSVEPDRVLVADAQISKTDMWRVEEEGIVHSTPSERCYIDLGFGLPDGHVDRLDRNETTAVQIDGLKPLA